MAEGVRDLGPELIERPRRPLALRALFWFWGVVLAVSIAGVGLLAYLGPPRPDDGPAAAPAGGAGAPPAAQTARAPPSATSPAPPWPDRRAVAAAPAADPSTAPTGTGYVPAQQRPPDVGVPPVALPRTAAAANVVSIRPPDPILLEDSAYNAPAKLPRIGADGQRPMLAYAAAFDPNDHRPRIGILVAGIGQSSTDSEEAIRVLPPAISFAISPYAFRPEHILDEIRASGHEMFISLPLEPQGYPLNDAGNEELLTGAVPEQNARRLDWVLSRIQGYVGATNALDGLRGERYSGAALQMRTVMQELANRGLMFVDAAPEVSRLPGNGAAPLVGAQPLVERGIDMSIDEPAVRSEIDAKLFVLEQTALDRGSALGLANLPRPVTLARLAAWAAALDAKGITLAPVSIVTRTPVQSPTAQAQPQFQSPPTVRPNLIR